MLGKRRALQEDEAGEAKAVDELREEARSSLMDSMLTGGLDRALNAALGKTVDFADEAESNVDPPRGSTGCRVAGQPRTGAVPRAFAFDCSFKLVATSAAWG